MELVKKLRVKYYATCPKTKMGLFKEPHVCFNDLNSCLSKLETQAKTIERLEAENKLLEECRTYFASLDDQGEYGFEFANETAKKIEALRKKE